MLTTKERHRRVGCSSSDLSSSSSAYRAGLTMAGKPPAVGLPSGDGRSGSRGADNSKVLISIDDTALLHGPVETTRARSLNRLDNVDDGDMGVDIYRCPSFPRLQKRCSSQVDSQTNCSMTHLETNSISPRVSTDNLTNVSRDDLDSGADVLAGYVGGCAGLIRSISSKTVDELPPLDLPVTQFARLGQNYLSPQQANGSEKTPHPVSRSTSCPSMAYVRRSPSPRPVRVAAPSGDPEKPSQQQQQQQQQQGADDNRGKSSNADAVFPDRRTTTGRDVTENGPPDGRKPTNNALCEEHPMHTKRLLEKQRDRLSLIKQNGELYRTSDIRFDAQSTADGRSPNEPNYVNIRDIPSAVAEKVMDKSTGGSTRAVHTVQKKCLQWLNSLDNDDSS